MTRRFWIGLAFAVPVFVLEMGGHLIGLTPGSASSASNWLQLLLATPVVLWAGWPFFERGWRSVVSRNLNMFTLIAMGTGVAWVYSVVATLAPGIFPAAFRNPDGSVAVYFEAAAVITVLVLLGQVLELRARESHERRDPRAPRSRAQDGAAHPPGRERGRGQARYHPGRRSPSRPAGREGAGGRRSGRGPRLRRRVDGDGRVHAGHERGGCTRDRGHDQPDWRPRDPRDKVGRDTMLCTHRPDGLGGTAQPRPIQRLADQVSGWFVPAVIGVAVLAFLAWALRPEPRFAYGLVAAVSVLIIACPCALGLASRCRSWSVSGAALEAC